MRPVHWALLIAGILALAVGVWMSLVLPIRAVSQSHVASGGGTFEITYQLNAWGKTLGYKRRVVFALPEMRPHGEGLGRIPDEEIVEGWFDWSGRNHGAWIREWRFGERWERHTEWYEHNVLVSINEVDTRDTRK